MSAVPGMAVVQMVSGPDLARNLAVAGRLLAEARAGGAVLAVLPENFALFGAGAPADFLRQQPPGRHAILDWLAETSRRLGLWLVGGSLPWLPAAMRAQPFTRVYSHCPLFSPAGDCVAAYNKMHLFDAEVADAQSHYRESDDFLAGDAPVCADTDHGRLGLAICYDLRFPELFRALVDQGAEIVCLPSAFTRVTGNAHWMPLIRARAIETQCYVLAANQGGQHSDSRATCGHSAIVSPWGEVLAMQADGEGLALAPVDLAQVQDCRRRMPVQHHRRMFNTDAGSRG